MEHVVRAASKRFLADGYAPGVLLYAARGTSVAVKLSVVEDDDGLACIDTSPQQERRWLDAAAVEEAVGRPVETTVIQVHDTEDEVVNAIVLRQGDVERLPRVCVYGQWIHGNAVLYRVGRLSDTVYGVLPMQLSGDEGVDQHVSFNV